MPTSVQKSQKGRLSGAPVTDELPRRKGFTGSKYRGGETMGCQQFGGVAARRDRNSRTLSGRARRALENQPQHKSAPPGKKARRKAA